jgi:hypothetical protein
MNKKRWLILLLVPLTTGLVGCVQEVVRTVEVTRVVQETVIVPRVREVVVTATPKPPYTPALRACQPDNCEPYFAGAETIRQYFAFIDQGLFEEAYNLFSQSKQDRKSLEDYIIGCEIYFRTVKVITIEPYSSPDPETEILYYVQYYNESKNEWESGVNYMLVRTIMEDSSWKINEFSKMTSKFDT